MTDSGRTVYGGNGITPDEKSQPPKLDLLEAQMLRGKYIFFNFVSHYHGHAQRKVGERLVSGCRCLEEELRQYTAEHGVEFTDSEFDQDIDWIRLQLKREMYSSAFGMDDANRLTIETDPEVAKAVDALPKAQALLDTAKRVIAQRVNK